VSTAGPQTATPRGLVSAFQDYSTQDGPGLRQTVFLKRCNLRCRWCANPETLRAGEELYFFPERIEDAQLALAENPGALAQTKDGWRLDRSALPGAEELIERNTQALFEPVGQWVTPAACARRLLRDRPFFAASGGGVTFSGGEPLLQAAFIEAVAASLDAEPGEPIHLAIDTAGEVPWAAFERLLGRVDLFLYDIKAADDDLHRRLTGAGNQRILANAQRLAAAGQALWVRLILVPGLNDSRQEVRRRLELTAALGAAVDRVDLLAYHSLGAGKYRRLGLDYELGELPGLDPAVVADALDRGRALGLPIGLAT
jgi:pyruvate formate lyase activating enzyme